MNENEVKYIVNLLRKQNAILADISKKLDVVVNRIKTDAESELDDSNDILPDMIPRLTDNEKSLAICRVVKDGILHTFNYGNCIESRKASEFEKYICRSADDEKKKA